jgi:type IV secretion system protein VirB3
MEEDQVSIDPLFVGMTRPAQVMGVPMEFFGINFIIFGIGMIAFTSIMGKIAFAVIVCGLLHAFGYIATEKEPHWMSIYLTKITKCGPTRNRMFWKTNSYKP